MSAATNPQHSARLGALIRQGRVRKGWNQHELAEHAGVSRTTLFHIERGSIHDPRASTLNKLAAALELSPEQLLPPHVMPRPPELLREQLDDLAANPAFAQLVERRADLAEQLTAADWAELSATFGVGGSLTTDGAITAAERLLADRETLARLRIVLQTHLRQPAEQLVEALYNAVVVTPTANSLPDRFDR